MKKDEIIVLGLVRITQKCLNIVVIMYTHYYWRMWVEEQSEAFFNHTMVCLTQSKGKKVVIWRSRFIGDTSNILTFVRPPHKLYDLSPNNRVNVRSFVWISYSSNGLYWKLLNVSVNSACNSRKCLNNFNFQCKYKI